MIIGAGTTLHQGFVPYQSDEVWRMYTKTPYSSTMLADGEGTAELLLEKTLEAYPVDMPAEEILAEVKEQNYVVFEDLRLTHGGAAWKEFYEKVLKRENAQIKLAEYYTLGDISRYSEEYYNQIKDEYPKMFFLSLVYVAGEGFFIGDRPSTATEPESILFFKYLKHYEGEAPTSYANFSRYDRYVLVDDNTATWEEIERQMYSSVLLEKSIAWRSVYCNLMD